MRIEIPHGSTPEEAKEKISSYLAEMQQRYAATITEADHRWEGNTLFFALKAKGMKGEGRLEVNDRTVVVEGKLPLIAKPFEGRIRSAIEKESAAIFRA